MIVRPVSARDLQQTPQLLEPPLASSPFGSLSQFRPSPFGSSGLSDFGSSRSNDFSNDMWERLIERAVNYAMDLIFNRLETAGSGQQMTAERRADAQALPRTLSNGNRRPFSLPKPSQTELPRIEIEALNRQNQGEAGIDFNRSPNQPLSPRQRERNLQANRVLPEAPEPTRLDAPFGSRRLLNNPKERQLRLYENNNNTIWSNVPEYGNTGRTPTDAPELGKARSSSAVTFGFDRYGNMQGVDKAEAFRLPTTLADDENLSIINDINETSSLVLNGRTRVTTDDDGNKIALIARGTVGLGDDLMIVMDADGTPRYAYDGTEWRNMEPGQEYRSNDNSVARWEEEERQLRIATREYQLALKQNREEEALTLSGRMSNRNDGRALGLLGVTTAEGRQFKGRTNAQIAEYAQTYSTINANRPFSAAIADHSARFNNNPQSGDEQAGVEFESVYSQMFYESLAELSDDTPTARNRAAQQDN